MGALLTCLCDTHIMSSPTRRCLYCGADLDDNYFASLDGGSSACMCTALASSRNTLVAAAAAADAAEDEYEGDSSRRSSECVACFEPFASEKDDGDGIDVHVSVHCSNAQCTALIHNRCLLAWQERSADIVTCPACRCRYRPGIESELRRRHLSSAFRTDDHDDTDAELSTDGETETETEIETETDTDSNSDVETDTARDRDRDRDAATAGAFADINRASYLRTASAQYAMMVRLRGSGRTWAWERR